MSTQPVDSGRPMDYSDIANILVVDDREDKLMAFQSILEDLGQNIVTARSGEEALKRVLEDDFAVILLDVNMPGLDGLETAALIRKRKKSAHTPIIFVTAYADEMHALKGYSLGAVDYILAPVLPEILQTKVRVFVELFCMTQQVKRRADERVALAREQAARAAAEEANRRSSFLAQASRVLAGSVDLEATVRALTRLVVPSLADLCALTLIDDEGRSQQTELVWVPPGSQQELRSMSLRTIANYPLALEVQKVIANRKAQLLTDLKPQRSAPATGNLKAPEWGECEPHFPVHSAVIFPLLARSRMLGVLCLAIGSSDRSFGSSDVVLAEDLAERAALALDKALLYQELRESDRRKTEFLAMLSHELRNPLAPIRNAAEILRQAGPDMSKVGWAKDVINRQVQQLTRLVDDLLDVSRITRGKIQLKLAPVDVSTVISAAVETSRPLIDTRRHELAVSLPAHSLWINADSARVAQVLSNLLNNAAKFTPEGGRISLSARREGDEAVFRVRDTGAGLAPERLGSIFDLFAQGDRAPNSSPDGLGIGLTLVRRLVEIHGGSVGAYSAGINKGSEFTVRLPLLTNEKTRAAAQEGGGREMPGATLTGLRVLVVDDNADVAESTAELLALAGCEVRLVHDGPAALQFALAHAPDVVLLDIGLPGMDGYEVARRLRAQPGGEQLILIAASGYGQEEDLRRSKEAGFDRHLVKPLEPAGLPALMASLRLERRSSGSASRPQSSLPAAR